MKNNNAAATANKQTAKNTVANTVNNIEARRKAREEQYRQFRIAALRRRCKRNKVSSERTEELVNALIKQFDEPATYNILVLFPEKDASIIRQIIANEKIEYNMLANTYGMFTGDKKLLTKLREVMPNSATIHPYAKKKIAVDAEEREKARKDKEKKHTKNTSEVKKVAKSTRKAKKIARFKARPKRKVSRSFRKSRNTKLSLRDYRYVKQQNKAA